MKDAELALSEANMLDGRMSQVWGYLALVSLMMARPSIFNQCMNQALRVSQLIFHLRDKYIH